NACLGRSVCRAPRIAAEPDIGRDIHNRAALLTLHDTDNCPTTEKSRGQIEIDHFPPVVQRKLFDLVSMQAPAGDVDEDIDAAVIRDDSLKSFLHVDFLGHIQGDERRLLAVALESVRDLFPAFFSYVQDCYDKIVSSQAFRYRLSNP